MSEIITDKLTGKTSAGDVTITDGSATMQLQQGIAKMWLYAQQRTATVEAKNTLNVSSWVDDNSGRCTTNLNNAMSGADYIISASHSYDATSGSGVIAMEEVWAVTSSQLKHDMNYNATFADCDYVYQVVFGDLA